MVLRLCVVGRGSGQQSGRRSTEFGRTVGRGAAPGVGIMEPVTANRRTRQRVSRVRPGERNMPFWGTSFSAAYVSGWRRWSAPDFGELTAHQVVNRILRRPTPPRVDNQVGLRDDRSRSRPHVRCGAGRPCSTVGPESNRGATSGTGPTRSSGSQHRPGLCRGGGGRYCFPCSSRVPGGHDDCTRKTLGGIGRRC